MASTFTTNIRLNKQGDGDNPNSWGQVLNEGVISLTDHAIAGIATISVGATTSVTLTSNNGAADEARSAILHIKGTVGGTHNTISLIVPANTKHYLINNDVSANTSTSNVLKIKTAAGDGYDIPFDSIGWVYCDNTSVRSVTTKGLNLGTAASADIGVCATNVPDTSLADIRYLRTSVTVDTTLLGTKTVRDGQFVISTSARAVNPITTLTDDTSIAVDFLTGNNFMVTLTDNRTLAAPSNATAGQTGLIYIAQDGTGNRTLGYNTVYKFVSGSVPVLTTTANAMDMLVYSARSATTIDAVMLYDFKR
tara:strand:- start:909 stop:1832 length:924 start_codon:yes stop_codon:yes gene_type:complete